jgi:hypothetical protein
MLITGRSDLAPPRARADDADLPLPRDEHAHVRTSTHGRARPPRQRRHWLQRRRPDREDARLWGYRYVCPLHKRQVQYSVTDNASAGVGAMTEWTDIVKLVVDKFGLSML